MHNQDSNNQPPERPFIYHSSPLPRGVWIETDSLTDPNAPSESSLRSSELPAGLWFVSSSIGLTGELDLGASDGEEADQSLS